MGRDFTLYGAVAVTQVKINDIIWNVCGGIKIKFKNDLFVKFIKLNFKALF